MPRFVTGEAGTAFVLMATGLSAFNGFLSVLTVLVITGGVSTRFLVSIYLPAGLWVLALACLWFPKSGFTAYATLLVTSMLFSVNPFHNPDPVFTFYRCCDNLRFALVGGALLFVNLFLPKEETG